MGKIVAVSMAKGGVGKTTLVTNLAGLLARQYGKKVLIVDTDGQGNSSLAYGVADDMIEKSLYDVIFDGLAPEDAIIDVGFGVHLLPSSTQLDFFDIGILTQIDEFKYPFHLLKKHLRSLKRQYDYIFIDSPPALGLMSANILTYTDYVVIPFVPEAYSVKGLIRLMKTIDDFKEKYNPDLEVIGFIANMVETRTNLHSEMLMEAKAFSLRSGVRMFQTIIPKSIRFASATAYSGQPAVWIDKNNPFVDAYMSFAEEFLEVMERNVMDNEQEG